MTIERVLRSVAVAIAILGIVDPALTLPWRARPIVGVAVVRPSPDEDSSLAHEPLSPAEAQALQARVIAALGREFDVRAGLAADAAAIVLIGDGRSPADLADSSLAASTVVSAVVPTPRASGVRITRVDAPRRAHIGGRVPIAVQLDARGLAGRSSIVAIRSDGLELARHTHTWRDASERTTITLDALPLRTGPTRFTVAVLDAAPRAAESATAPARPRDDGATGAQTVRSTAGLDAAPRAAESTTARARPRDDGATNAQTVRSAAVLDAVPRAAESATAPARPGDDGTTNGQAIRSTADAAVEIHDRPVRVLFVNARPSWSTTFIRRALEDDPRFAVASATRISRGIMTTTAGAPSSLASTDPDDFHAVVVGAPELLTKDDVERLSTFARVRGGLVVFAPDRRPEGPAAALMPARGFAERLLPEPVALRPAVRPATRDDNDTAHGSGTNTRRDTSRDAHAAGNTARDTNRDTSRATGRDMVDVSGDNMNRAPARDMGDMGGGDKSRAPARDMGGVGGGNTSRDANRAATDDGSVRLWASELAVPQQLLPGTDTLLGLGQRAAASGQADTPAFGAPASASPRAPTGGGPASSATSGDASPARGGQAASSRAPVSGGPASSATGGDASPARGGQGTSSGVATERATSVPVVIQSPLGEGLVLVSGALDAWRYRDRAESAFDRFWRDTIAARAQAVPEPVEIVLEPAIARPGDRVDVAVRVRTTRGRAAASTATDATSTATHATRAVTRAATTTTAADATDADAMNARAASTATHAATRAASAPTHATSAAMHATDATSAATQAASAATLAATAATNARTAATQLKDAAALAANAAAHATIAARLDALMTPLASSLEASARTPAQAATAGSTPVRLWPDARPSAYDGALNAPSQEGVYAVSVQLDERASARATLWVERDVRVARPMWAGLQAFVEARQGRLVTADQLDRLAPQLRDSIRPPDARHARHPLRSAWWIVPFAACLGGEWLLRRRRGER